MVGTGTHDGAGGVGVLAALVPHLNSVGTVMLRAFMMACITLSWERYSIFDTS